MSLRALTDDGRLIDVVAIERDAYEGSRELVVTNADDCPRCGYPMVRESVFQDALVRGGGYGGTQRVDTDWCSCGYERVVAVATERPPREDAS